MLLDLHITRLNRSGSEENLSKLFYSIYYLIKWFVFSCFLLDVFFHLFSIKYEKSTWWVIINFISLDSSGPFIFVAPTSSIEAA